MNEIMANYKYTYRYDESADINISSSNVLWASLNYVPLANKQITAIRTKDHTATNVKFVILDGTYEVLWVSDPIAPVNGVYETINLNLKFSKDILLGIVFQGGFLRGKTKTGTLGTLNYTSLTYTSIAVGSKFPSYSGGSNNEMLYEIDYVEYFNKFLISSGDKYYSLRIPVNKNVIPAMISNTSPSGIARASSEIANYEAYKAFNGVVSDLSADAWVGGTSLKTGWLSYQFDSPKMITKYQIVSRGGQPTNAPKSWTLQASNDGVNWTDIDQRVNITGWVNSTPKEFSLSINAQYSHYKLMVTDIDGGTYLAIGEFMLFENPKVILTETINGDEKDFLTTGMDISQTIDVHAHISDINYLRSDSNSLGSGKIFKQKIDTTKIPIKKASIT